MICEKCAPRELKAMRALESLTPSGSEFVNDVERCVEFVRRSQASQMRAIVSFKKDRDELLKALEMVERFMSHEDDLDELQVVIALENARGPKPRCTETV